MPSVSRAQEAQASLSAYARATQGLEVRHMVDECKVCGASVTNDGQNPDGENVPFGVCYLCYKSPLFKPEMWP
jgi:hypothetical protein